MALSSCLALPFVAAAARAQDHSTALGGTMSVIGLLTSATHTPAGRSLTEAYLTQPVATGFLDANWFRALGTVDLEGLTLRRGELDLGAWGEGYVDRRHPHAYVHELLAGAEKQLSSGALSLYAGRSFVSFGSDDPMVRPFVSYPVDHHLAQILERLVVVAAARVGAITAEASVFDGDEPLDPSTPPRFSRFADSWAVRGTLVGDRLSRALPGVELSASYAAVKSPEFRDGGGLDQRKAHASLRLTGEAGAFTRYTLLEAARTSELDRGRGLYTLQALLAEGAVCRHDVGIGLRWERSDRPEEDRLLDLFRAPRPATDVSVLGITEWTTVTGALALPGVGFGTARAAPFLEVARATVGRTTAALFDPARFYGATAMWRVSGGIRVAAGDEHTRMGRYGAAHAPTPMIHHAAANRREDHRCFS
jgi:hypothetical protein